MVTFSGNFLLKLLLGIKREACEYEKLYYLCKQNWRHTVLKGYVIKIFAIGHTLSV